MILQYKSDQLSLSLDVSGVSVASEVVKIFGTIFLNSFSQLKI